MTLDPQERDAPSSGDDAHTGIDESAFREVWRRIALRRDARRRARRRLRVGAGVGVSIALSLALVWWPGTAIGPRLDMAAGGPSAGPLSVAHGGPGSLARALTVVTKAGRPRVLGLTDGSRVRVTAGARVSLVRNDDAEVGFELARGTVDLAVVPGGPRRWVVHAGHVRVVVLGTRFSVSRDADGVDVAVTRGRVAVHVATVPGAPVALAAGEQRWFPVPGDARAAAGRPSEATGRDRRATTASGASDDGARSPARVGDRQKAAARSSGQPVALASRASRPPHPSAPASAGLAAEASPVGAESPSPTEPAPTATAPSPDSQDPASRSAGTDPDERGAAPGVSFDGARTLAAEVPGGEPTRAPPPLHPMQVSAWTRGYVAYATWLGGVAVSYRLGPVELGALVGAGASGSKIDRPASGRGDEVSQGARVGRVRLGLGAASARLAPFDVPIGPVIFRPGLRGELGVVGFGGVAGPPEQVGQRALAPYGSLSLDLVLSAPVGQTRLDVGLDGGWAFGLRATAAEPFDEVLGAVDGWWVGAHVGVRLDP